MRMADGIPFRMLTGGCSAEAGMSPQNMCSIRPDVTHGPGPSLMRAFLPVERERFPEVMRYVKGKRGSEGPGDDERYIYIDFADGREYLFVDINRDSASEIKHSKEEYDRIFMEAGFKNIATDRLTLREEQARRCIP